MSGPAREVGDGEQQEGQLPVPYEVGYARPPAEHRFQKGRSGNPHGRPKGARNKPAIDFSFGNRATEELLKQEAYRTVTLREGSELIELPVIQAVFRAMGVSALKGNRFAQRSLAEMVKDVETKDQQSKLEYFQTMFTYKHEWTKEVERCRRAGIEAPEPIPHPDDIILDPNNGNVRVLGPKTKEQKERYDRTIAARDEMQLKISDAARRYRSARSADKKAEWFEVWHFAQNLFDKVNEALGPRYRIDLTDRSYAEGASRKGAYGQK